ncbi:MAG TPA: nitroreductase family protein [Candidatus Dormibacteraeota bacterium]|nr:nitroreductase family protein [Candidatus Dormibacteraeota bacterium]
MPDTKLIKSLRSVRQFSDREIPDDVLRDILDTGRWAGSAKNSQPWDLVVVTNRDTLTALSKCGRFAGHLAGAKLALALVMRGDDVWSGMDEGRLMQNLMLAAWAHGVGSCIGSIYPEHQQRARELLGIPENRYLRTVLSIGYPASPEALRLPPNAGIPRGRRPLDDLVSRERLGTR